MATRRGVDVGVLIARQPDLFCTGREFISPSLSPWLDLATSFILAHRWWNFDRTDGTIGVGTMSSDDLPILYIKPGCPWCHEALEFLGSHGIGYREKDVSSDARAMNEMRQKSGQTKTPTLDWHGQILADFGLDELVPFLQKQNVKLEDS